MNSAHATAWIPFVWTETIHGAAQFRRQGLLPTTYGSKQAADDS